ncbi:MAG: autotransporter domain-containing protein, partial [Aliarcobacter sp.]|nr:autotransporter domain-containing protein [Aliarcobacter sp.]
GNYTGTAITYNADGTVKLADNKNITSSVITNGNDTGTLTLLGTSTVSGAVGGIGALLKVVNAGATGEIATFSSDVYATNLNVTGTGEVDLNGNYTGTAITYNADGTVKLADNKNITSSVITNGNDTGTLTLLGTSTVSGAVGGIGALLKVVNAGATGEIATFSSDVYATNLNVTGTGEVDLNGNYTGTAITYNADGTVKLADNKNITSAVITNGNNTGTLTLLGTSTVSGAVGGTGALLKVVNAGATGATSTFSSDVYATNLNVIGTGEVDLNGNYTGTAITYNADGTVKLADNKNITSAVITNGNNTGTLTLLGTSTVSGAVGGIGALLKVVNAGATGEIATFSSDVYATTTNIASGEIKFEGDLTSNIVASSSTNGIVTFVGALIGNTQNVSGNIGSSGNLINTLNIGESGGTGKYSTTIIAGNVYATNTILNNGTSNNSVLELTNGSNITSNITTSNNGQGILTFLGDSIATGTIGTSTEKLAQINAGATGKTVTFNSSVNSDNLNISGDGTVVLADNANINAPITTTTGNQGILTFNGTSTVSGDVGTSGAKLKEINAGVTGENVTFEDSVNAGNLNVTGTGTVNLNTLSGSTISDITFNSTGTANLNGDLTGDINFSGNNAIVNVSDGKGILGSVQTLANNTGILNYNGDGTISGNIGSSGLGVKELNINTGNNQNSTDGVLVTFDALGREIYADIVALKNNATLTLSDDVNIINTGSDNLIITVDSTNTGTLTFQGSSNIEGEVGESNKVLNTINAGATGKTVTFDDMVYATTLKYSDNGTVVLNGDTTSNSSEAIVGTVDFDNKAGTLGIGDNVNLTTGTSGIQFANANSATLRFNGSSIVTGVLGGNTAGNSTLERIYAGADGETVTFKNDVYVEESNDTTFHVSGTGTVNFEGNLTGDLIYDADGVVNVSNGKSIIVSTVPTAVRTGTDNTGTLNFLGTTTLYSDIGTSTKKLKNVTFASDGTSADSYDMNLSKNIYAQNSYIGNGSNNTTINVTDNITFGGNLDLRKNSILNVSDYDLTVANNLDIATNSTLKFKVYTTDISAGEAVENPKSGSITANSITLASDTKININYDGSWYGAGKYNLITANSLTGTYYGTESNGLVSDNSIIDSIVKNDGTNLTLYADRTGGGSYEADNLYIIKSEIGDHYSNGASQALAGYANEAQREGALADIIRRLEELEGGTVLTADKKAEMVRTQKLLAPVANNSTIKSSLVATNTVLSTISDRISDIRGTSSMDFIPWGGEYSGLSSGDYMQDYALWIKVMGSKATQSKVKDYDGYETSTYGLVAGVDKTLRDGTTIGVALSNADTKIDQTDFRAGDSSSTKSIQLSAYASSELGDGYVDGVISYAKHSTDGTRTANSGKLTSSVDADQLAAKVETGYRIYLEDAAVFTPFASFEFGTLNQKAYTEKGTAYQNDALKVGNTKITKGNVGLGTKISTNLNLGNVVIVPEVKFGVYNAIGDKNADIKAQYTGGGNEFVTPTQDLTDTMYKAGIGVKTNLSHSTSLMLGVDYDRSKDGSFQGYSGNASFRISF